MRSFFYQHRRLFLNLWQAAVVVLSLTTAFLLRFDFALPRSEAPFLRRGLMIALAIKLVIFVLARLDRGWWRFVSMQDLVRILAANAVASRAFVLAASVILGPRLPRAIFSMSNRIRRPVVAVTTVIDLSWSSP